METYQDNAATTTEATTASQLRLTTEGKESLAGAIAEYVSYHILKYSNYGPTGKRELECEVYEVGEEDQDGKPWVIGTVTAALTIRPFNHITRWSDEEYDPYEGDDSSLGGLHYDLDEFDSNLDGEDLAEIMEQAQELVFKSTEGRINCNRRWWS